MLPDVLSVIAKALSFVCALQAAGIALFLQLFGGQGAEVEARVRRLGTWSALSAVALVGVHYALEPARMAGELAGIADWGLQKFVATSNAAIAAALRIVGLLWVALAMRPGAGRSAWIGAVLIALSFAATGHTAAHSYRWALAALLVIHLLVIEFWFGALLPLILCTRGTPEAAGQCVRRFSRLATALVPLIFFAGLGMALALVPDLRTLNEPYGRLLLLKVAGFAAVLALAALNKWKLAPALEAGHVEAARRFRWSVGAECILIGAVLVATAVMTSFFSPEP